MPVPLNFSVTSRYYGLETATLTGPDGTQMVYLRRRFLPQPARLAMLREHIVVDGDRLDLIASTYLGDPLLWWRVADANRALNPEELTDEPGRHLRITLPEGVPGLPNA